MTENLKYKSLKYKTQSVLLVCFAHTLAMAQRQPREVSLKLSQNPRELCVVFSFLEILQDLGLHFIKKETPRQVFSFEFFEIIKITSKLLLLIIQSIVTAFQYTWINHGVVLELLTIDVWREICLCLALIMLRINVCLNLIVNTLYECGEWVSRKKNSHQLNTFSKL